MPFPRLVASVFVANVVPNGRSGDLFCTAKVRTHPKWGQSSARWGGQV